MDKYEYKLKLDQMKALTAEKKYPAAAEIADTINWHKIKNVNALIKAGEVYENVGRYEESKEILLTAYDRSPIGRMIVYRLTRVAVKMGLYDEAQEYYKEFVEIAPHDNLKYVLQYEIKKAQGADLRTLIGILEELKEQEYSEEWAYELAYLYHKAGMSEQCIDACDELILWFGDGPYVERALELKMLYQPLNRQQEEKYRQFRLKKDGVVEVTPRDALESGEIVSETVQIPRVGVSAERFNTQNLQEELQKSMQQIMDATEKGAVDDGMDNIKKLVEEIPYLQLPKEETEPEETEHIETDAEIDDSLKTDFREFLAEDRDGQISLFVPEQGLPEPQVTGQMSIEDVLAEWEKTKRAAEAALQAAEQRKLESAKARALAEAGDIMDRLADVIPKLDSGLTPRELLEQQYLAGEPIEEDRAAEMVANMNQLLQKEIDRLSDENAQMDERIAAVGNGNVLADAVGLTPELAAAVTGAEADADLGRNTEAAGFGVNAEPEAELGRNTEAADAGLEASIEPEAELETNTEAADAELEAGAEAADMLADELAVGIASGVQELMPQEKEISTIGEEQAETEDLYAEQEGLTGEPAAEAAGPEKLYAESAAESASSENLSEPTGAVSGELSSEAAPAEDLTGEPEEAEIPLPEIPLPEELFGTPESKKAPGEKLPEISEPEDDGASTVITHLTAEQKNTFSYFVPIKGMERQLCQALTGEIRHLKQDASAASGNMIIQGAPGSGKTVLATDMIKALQKATGKLTGRIGKIEASVLNQKDAAALLERVSGGCLIIEKAGELSKETEGKLAKLLAENKSGVLVMIEDSRRGIEKALGKDANFAARFSEKITIPIFTSDELVAFARSYANELGYTIDEMGILALYNSISSIQKLDQATTLAEVKEIVDQAVKRSEHGGLKKAFSILTSRRYDADDYVILHEKDFEF